MTASAMPSPPAASSSLRGMLRRVADAPRSPRSRSTTSSTTSTRCAAAPSLRGRIVGVVPETAHSATLVIRPGRDWAGHEPGTVRPRRRRRRRVRLWRTYSLTHGPRRDRCISVTVKAIPDGVVSNYLVHRAQVGEMIQLAQAEGEFVLPQPLPPKLLLVTAGSGITPVIGMLRNLFSRATPPAADITLVHVNPSESASIFRDELRSLGAAGWITLVERYDDQHGLLDVSDLTELVPDPRRAADLRLRAGRPARRARGAPRRARPGADHGAVPAAAGRARRGRHRHLHQRRHPRRRRRHPDPRRRRGRRRT